MDEIRIGPHSFAPLLDPSATGAGPAQDQGSFLGTLKDAIEQTNAAQMEARSAVERMVTGGDQSLHQTLVALQKADVSFQLMMQVRNKIVAAYEEIQRMQL